MNNINIATKETENEGMNWIHMANACEQGNEPLSSIKG
jgi:hypothetical protein